MSIASSSPALVPAPAAWDRVWRIVRLNLVNKWTVIWIPAMIMFFIWMLFFFAVGAFSASLFMRWRMNGILVAGAVLALLIVGAIALITYTQSWPAVGDWFAANGPLGVTAWLLLPTALAAVAGYAVLK